MALRHIELIIGSPKFSLWTAVCTAAKQHMQIWKWKQWFLQSELGKEYLIIVK